MRKILGFFICFMIIMTSQIYATDWYVRPAGGNYGLKNGTSYADAWDGIANITWGTGGVIAGDTLYVCGLHVNTYTGGDLYTGWTYVVSGTNESTRVTIRGDYSGDEGIVWGGHLLSHESWVDEGSNTYSITMPGGYYGDWFFEDVTASSWVVLDKETTLADCKANPGSFYAASWGTGDTLYVHTSDGLIPTDRIVANNYGYKFDIADESYITFLNLKFYRFLRPLGSTQQADHITWDGCILQYGKAQLLAFWDDCDYMVVKNSELSWAGNGVYGIWMGGNPASHITVSGNTIHDIGVRAINQNSDAHAVSFQGGGNHIIEDNYIYNSGYAINLYAYQYQEQKDNIIRRNFVKDNHNLGSSTAYAISLQCNASSLSDKSGNQIYENIITNCINGFKIQYEDEVQVYNNVVHNSGVSFLSARSGTGAGPNIKARNNISLNPTTFHIDFNSTSANAVCDYDYNLYYPDGAAKFSRNSSDYNLSGWQGAGYDANSSIGDPSFVNAGGSYDLDTDFKIPTDSPAIDTGVDVGLSQDYEGTSIPQGSAPDIGAYEYTGSVYPLNANINASPTSGEVPVTVNFTGSASGGTSPYSYSWNFGDGSSSSDQNPSHIYSQAGSYNVTLTVTDSNSSQASDSLIITASSPPLSASASASPTSGEVPLNVNFTASASGGTSPYTYIWNFGDGNTSSSQNPSHTYSQAGTYSVILTVTDNNSSQASDSLTITASGNASYSLTISSATGSPAPGEGGTTEPLPGNHSYSIGSSTQIKASPNENYRFSKWTGDVSGSNAYNKEINITMDKDKSITGYFFTKCGDVNGDLSITPADAQAAFDIFLGRISNPTDSEKENADVNGDGTKTEPNITPADAQAIFEKFLGKSELPSDCSGNTRAASVLTQMRQAPNVNLIINDVQANLGEEIFVPIIVDNPLNIKAFGFDLLFPSKILEFVGVERTDLQKDFDQVDANKIAEGVVRVGGYRSTPIMNHNPRVLITLIFRVIGEAKKPTSFTIINTVDDVENASVINGMLTKKIKKSMHVIE